jgi:hypothetical protein
MNKEFANGFGRTNRTVRTNLDRAGTGASYSALL